MVHTTLTYLLTDDRVCLGFKKRGFGEGNWNGYGGKVDEGETPMQSAVRETEEESAVLVAEKDLEQAAFLEFFFENGEHIGVHTYFVRIWKGEPEETEEMKPSWFLFKDIPYDLMWEDDRHWFPRALKGEKLKGKVWFDHTNKHIKKMEWENVSTFE